LAFQPASARRKLRKSLTGVSFREHVINTLAFYRCPLFSLWFTVGNYGPQVVLDMKRASENLQ
jgi:hypothetical protein